MNEECGCCEGVEILTPASTANRPGLSALAYRVGTHATFRATLQARLSGLNAGPLAELKTRDPSDLAIALLDAWATVADVLTFYQERIANEGYLRTATERRSVLELARLVGYMPRPGVAASVYLAYTLESGHEVTIPAGSKAQAVPGPGEQMQTFETGEDLEARAAWNRLTPRLTRLPLITLDEEPKTDAANIRKLSFMGMTTNLRPGDALLVVFRTAPNESRTGRQVLRWLETVELEPPRNRTVVTLQARALRHRSGPTPIVSRAEEVILHHREVRAFHVSPQAPAAGRVVEHLERLQQWLTPQMTDTEVAARIEAVLPALREERRTVRPGTNQPAWLDSLIAALTGLRRSALPPGADGAASAALAVTDAMQQLSRTLQRSPTAAVPPASPRQLPRRSAELLAPESDVIPQLLTALHPELITTLYPAWANARVTDDPDWSVQALRVKAAPFGHNAPLRPVYGEGEQKNVIIGYEEWPLGGSEMIRLQVLVGGGGEPVGAEFSIKTETETWAGQAGLRADSRVDIGERRVVITVTREAPPAGPPDVNLRFEFFALQKLGPVIEISKHGESWRVGANSPPNRVIASGQMLRYKTAGCQVTVAFPQVGANNEHLMVVVIESPHAPQPRNILPLDAEYNQVTPGSWVAVVRPDGRQPIITRTTGVQTVSKAAYGITGKVTELTLEDDWLLPDNRLLSDVRGITVYTQSEPLVVAEEPIETPIGSCAETANAGSGGGARPGPEAPAVTPMPPPAESPTRIELGELYAGLKPGRWTIIEGERKDAPGARASELTMLEAVTQGIEQLPKGTASRDRPGDKVHTFLTLSTPLNYCYKRDTVTIYGNVVGATHGETRSEVLGSGDGTKALQSFALRQSPLTYLSAQTPSGMESTLKVRVDDVLWHEAAALAELGPRDRRYLTRTDDDAKTTVIFGSGERGARLPTGTENLKADYRSGIGKPGNVRAEQISLLASRPLGVKEVINPLPATGGADRESRDQARENAPLGVTALGRLVSVRDYEDFARTFAGVGKASAVRLSDGRRQLIHLTIAGVDDVPIAPTSDLYRNLCVALHDFGDPHQPVQVQVRSLRVILIVANVKVLTDYAWELVEPKIRAALLDAFSFERRALGQDLLLSEVIATIQGVRGVAYVDVDSFAAVTEDELLDRQSSEAGGETAHLAALSQPGEPDPGRPGLPPGRQVPPGGQDKGRIPVSLASTRTENGQRVIRPAEIAFLTPAVPDTLILTELK